MFAAGDWNAALNELDIIEQEIWGHCKAAEKEELSVMRRKIQNLVLNKRVSQVVLKDAIRNYSRLLFDIRTARKMDLPRRSDPGRALTSGDY